MSALCLAGLLCSLSFDITLLYPHVYVNAAQPIVHNQTRRQLHGQMTCHALELEGMTTRTQVIIGLFFFLFCFIFEDFLL